MMQHNNNFEEIVKKCEKTIAIQKAGVIL